MNPLAQFLFCFFLMAIPTAHGSSQARAQSHTSAATGAAAVRCFSHRAAAGPPRPASLHSTESPFFCSALKPRCSRRATASLLRELGRVLLGCSCSSLKVRHTHSPGAGNLGTHSAPFSQSRGVGFAGRGHLLSHSPFLKALGHHPGIFNPVCTPPPPHPSPLSFCTGSETFLEALLTWRCRQLPPLCA